MQPNTIKKLPVTVLSGFLGAGKTTDQANITQALDDCLLSEEDVLRGKAYWKTLNDPFPTWKQNV
jgi:hypothetical protein